MEPTDIARAILSGLLAEPSAIDAAATAVTTWVAEHPADVGEHLAAWTAARSVQAALDALDAGATALPSPAQVRVFRDLPIAARVAVALHEFCGFDDAAIAVATARPVDEVERLLDSIAPPADAAPAPPPPRRPAPDPFPDANVHTPGPSRRRRTDQHPKAGGHHHHRKRPRWWIIVAVVVLALVAGGLIARNLRDDDTSGAQPGATSGLGDAATLSRDQLSKGCATPAGDAEVAAGNIDVEVDGDGRSYRLIAAAPLAPGRPRPLLIDFGDLGQTVDQHVAETRFDQLAGALKLVVATVAPADGRTQWNVTETGNGPADAALVERIIKDQTSALCVDQTRILLAGRGAGAHFASAFACSHPGLVSGLILVAGVYRPPTCPTPSRLSILAMLGSDDQVFPLNGGTGPAYAAALESAGGAQPGGDYSPSDGPDALDAWARSLDCVGTATQPIGLLTVRIATSCEKDGEVWRGLVNGAGHEWFPATYDIVVQFLTMGPFPTA